METLDIQKSIPYLKAKLPLESGKHVIETDFDNSPVLLDLNNGLIVTYLVDIGERFRYVQNRHLSETKSSADELHSLAIDNLYTLAEEHLRIQRHGSIYAVFLDGNFEASVLLLDTVWDISLAPHVSGGYAAALPTRDVLAFGDLNSSIAIQELTEVIQRLEEHGGDHKISTSLWARYEKGWRTLDA